MATTTKKDSKISTKTSVAKSVEDIITTEDDVMDASVEEIISDDNDEGPLSDITGDLIQNVKEALPESLNLYAKTDILYSSHQYTLGEELPTDNQEMVDAWLRAGTAEWR